MANKPLNLKDFQELARLALPKMSYDFYAGGAEDQQTLEDNVQAFSRITIRPRILIDVSTVNMITTVLGCTTSAPIMVAPTAFHKLAHPQGEVATARAAAASNVIMVLSFMSMSTIEEVAASSSTALHFMQLCLFKQRELSAMMVQRAERNGFKAIVVTVDVPRLGRREADIKNNMISPLPKNLEGLLTLEVPNEKGRSKVENTVAALTDQTSTWKDIAWLKSITNLPILIKGILTREDALRALEARVSGIIVSNHGGRQLDSSPATITVLEEVVVAMEGRIPVLMDGGVRRGTDVFKALALGAQAVMVGRPIIYGLAAKGEDGVKQVIDMLKHEFEVTMALAGCRTLKDISRNHVKTEHDRLDSKL